MTRKNAKNATLSGEKASFVQDPNSHVRRFVDHYCTLECPPYYAVLLKGKWGSGKTWFIKKVLNGLELKGIKCLYISLYGSGDYDDVNYRMFSALYPKLSSKGMVLAGQLMKVLVKAGFKADLNEVDITSYMSHINDTVLVFDDIERCSINVVDVLGYVNEFVEHQGCKVVVVGNEDEFQLSSGEDEFNDKYYKIKEKVIGKTFSILPCPHQALSSFLSDIKNADVRSLCEKNADQIITLYLISQYQNLRCLRQVLLDFERLYDLLSQEVRNIEPLVLELLEIYMVLSFEVKSGNMKPEDIEGLRNEYIDYLIALGIESDIVTNNYKRLSEKYLNISFIDLVLDLSIWKELIDEGRIDYESLNRDLSKTKYLTKIEEVSWRKLWYWTDLADDEFEASLEDVSTRFQNDFYKELPVLMHVVGILLSLSAKNLYNKDKDAILKEAKEKVLNLRAENLLQKQKAFFTVSSSQEDWGGLGFQGKDQKEFTDFYRYLTEQVDQAVSDTYADVAKTLIEDMVNDVEMFSRKLCEYNYPEGSYCNVAVLIYIDSTDFVNAFLGIPSRMKKYVCQVLKKRYKEWGHYAKLRSEVNWLNSVISKLKESTAQSRGKLSKYLIDNIIIPDLKECVDILNTVNGDSVDS